VVHDRELLDRLSAFEPIRFDGEVFRATRRGLDPLAASLSGGRWMIPNERPTLYTSMERDGALAEISYHWTQLTPIPSKPAAIHRIRVATSKTVRLARAELVRLGVDWERYGELNYVRTQEIGAALAHLECDGLIAPSARWPCDNVMLFLTNYIGDDDISVLVESSEVDWLSWARDHKLIET
jgi:hypothetical protein